MYKWINYDLHMHSEYSKPYDNKRVKDMSAKDFVDTLINKEVEVFSITDHNVFSAKYYKEIQDYIADKNIKLIPGCEFNIYVNASDKFQANIYFSLDVDYELLEKSISELYANNNKPKFSEVIDKLNKNAFNFIIFPEADKSNGGIKKIWKIIDGLNETNRFFKNGMQRIFRSYDSSDAFNKESADNWALSYYKNTQDFASKISTYSTDEIEKITNNISDRIKGKEYSYPNYSDISDELYEIITNYSECFSYFHFSDWHNNEEYNPKHKNYIFGNIDLPYESLELATLDPKSRVIIDGEELIGEPIGYLKELYFKMNGADYQISFERGLNAIIGERASGKSLLMAIILKLVDKGNTKLSDYKSYNIDIDSIKGVTFDGTAIKAGQLNSLNYIEQNTISKIFNNPDSYVGTISNFYEKLDDIDTSGFDDIVSLLKLLEKYNTNYKSITSYLNNHKRFNVFAYKSLERIDTYDIKNDLASFSNYANRIIKDVEKMGISSEKIQRIVEEFKEEMGCIAYKVNSYNKLIDYINDRIDEINNDNANNLRAIQIAINNYDSAKEIIFDNFNNLLLFKKVNYLVDNFKINDPGIKLNKKGKFLFVSACQISNDLPIIIKDTIANSMNLRGNRNVIDGIDALRKYLKNEVTLKTSISNVYSSLERRFITDNIKNINTLYEIKEKIDITEIKTMEHINLLSNNNQLENISSSSLGRKSIAYLEIMMEDASTILMFDQPEDNIDNHYISNSLVPIIKEKKLVKQLIFITHNPSIAVYADAFNYIFATNKNNKIEYTNYYIEKRYDKDNILNILDGGSPSFSNRNLKYGNIIGEYRYANDYKKR